ncbi:TonB-dependent receptor [Oleiagrimonas soli]|uniref:TonB-dependent receptor n=1 Tax=Oleiagrimonas soli TaxID=1543381 RepID=A0A099CZ07_9GAMM|nr:TonB-dependent receptor [Oleiagrimonas soli]KGI78969.1 TonB-dependent receptor [Oleiagrimonas soli]MBB6184513.1 TonB-dependent receptor [Oleiagrimonas soli]
MKQTRYTVTLLAAMIAAALAQVQAATPEHAASTATTRAASDATAQSTSTPDTQAKKKTRDKKKQSESFTELQAVTVTPLRQSLESAQSIKRDARMVVDSVVAEDIGKLPDNTVADALQRVTGVQVAQGFTGETSTVVVRGLPNVVTTLNGREIFNAGGRQFSFQDLPATAVSALKVYKTTDAQMVTGGIAGTVDIRTFRPFDFKGRKIAATLTGVHQKYGGHTDPTASLLVSNRWKTADHGEFGALLNMGITTMHYDYNAAFVDDNLTRVLTDGSGNPVRTSNGNLIVGPNSFGANYNTGWRKRPEANYALQWKPNDSTEMYLEGMYTWLSEKYDQPFYGTVPVNVVTPTQVTAGAPCFPIGLTSSPYAGQTICPLSGAQFNGNFYAFTSTQAHQDWGHNSQNAFGIKWHGENLTLSSDLSHNASSYENDNFVVDQFMDAYNTPLSFNYNAPNSFNFPGNPQLDPSRFYLNGLYQQWNNNKATQTAWRGDGNYYFGGNFVSSLDFGLRYADTEVKATGASLGMGPPGGAYLADGSPNPANNVYNLFGDSYFCQIPRIPVVPDGAITGCYDYLKNNADALRTYYGLPTGKLPAQKGQYFNIGEKTLSAYAQINYANELFGIPYDGLIGVRVEKVKRNLNAYTFDTASSLYSPIGLNTDETNVLPNATFNLHFTDQLQMRLSAGKTIQYPAFGQLNPSLTLSPATANTIATGGGGNPNLQPTKSNSYDATLEWYFSDVGSVTGGVFYHDITGYIENYTFEENINGTNYLISGPKSAGKGHLDGVELAYTQFFSFLPGAWSGLGVQANYTYIDSQLKTPSQIDDGFVTTSFQNVSKNNYNLVLMYEKYGFSARLAYNYRSRYPEFFLAASSVLGNNAQMYDEPANMLDLSLSYDVNKHLTVVLNATNLNHANFHSYAGPGTGLPQDYRYQDRSVGLGVRLKL